MRLAVTAVVTLMGLAGCTSGPDGEQGWRVWSATGPDDAREVDRCGSWACAVEARLSPPWREFSGAFEGGVQRGAAYVVRLEGPAESRARFDIRHGEPRGDAPPASENMRAECTIGGSEQDAVRTGLGVLSWTSSATACEFRLEPAMDLRQAGSWDSTWGLEVRTPFDPETLVGFHSTEDWTT